MRLLRLSVLVITSCVMFAGVPVFTETVPGTSELISVQESFVKIADEATRSIVNISTVKTVRGPQMDQQFPGLFHDDMFRRFFEVPDREYKQQSLGSGVIIDKKGYILTNNHVIEGADEIIVTLSDNREFKGTIIGSDPKTDIAVIKIEADNLVSIKLGNSDTIKVGQWAIAIGSPFGLTKTVTAGIISAKGRSQLGVVDYEDFIQTDAAINPGNSGGALINIQGEMIGINTAIFSRSGGYQGIGFAIPVNMAKTIMNDIIKHGRIIRGWLGVTIQPVDENLAKQFGLASSEGALISDVVGDSPAAQAGIKRGDVVISYNGKTIANPTELRNLVASTEVGKKIPVSVVRNGKKKQLTAKIGELKEDQASSATTFNKLGFTVQELTSELAERFGIPSEKGVIVSKVSPSGKAAEVGLKPGDVIREINRVTVSSVGEFNKAVSQLKKGDKALLLISRGRLTTYIVLEAVE